MKIVKKKKWLIGAANLIAGVVISASASGFGGGGGGGGGANPASDYAEEGNRATTSQRGGSSCTIYRPTNLTGNHPIILWGNGTGNRPNVYEDGLFHLASWGFVVAAANTTNAGTGNAMLGCLDWLESSNLRDQLDFSKVGTSGHSQGGGGSIMSGRDARIDATAPMTPYIIGLGHDSSSQSRQRGPMLLLSGSSDFIASRSVNQAPAFRRANVPVFWATRNGAGHGEPSGNFGDFRGLTTAWFLYLLKDDADATDLFEGANCGFCDVSGWVIERKGF